MDLTVVVGLGNPGQEYEGTRHNVGFMVIDRLCEAVRLRLRPARGEYLVAETRRGGRALLLVKPVTYMNNSGLAVEEVLRASGVPLEKLLVVVDDIALPLGTLRFRPGGSDGGHNGLYSVIYQLGSNGFPRLRCGILATEPPSGAERARYVLSPFPREDQERVTAMIERAAEACMTFAHTGLTAAMNGYNAS